MYDAEPGVVLGAESGEGGTLRSGWVQGRAYSLWLTAPWSTSRPVCHLPTHSHLTSQSMRPSKGDRHAPGVTYMCHKAKRRTRWGRAMPLSCHPSRPTILSTFLGTWDNPSTPGLPVPLLSLQ